MTLACKKNPTFWDLPHRHLLGKNPLCAAENTNAGLRSLMFISNFRPVINRGKDDIGP